MNVIPGQEPYGIAVDIRKSAKTVVLQLKEPIRMGKGSGPTDEPRRLDMRQDVPAFHCRTG